VLLLIAGVTAPSAQGGPRAAPAPAAPGGIQVRTLGTLETDYVWFTSRPAEPVQPITLVGPRNGWFTGRVVVSSQAAIRGLKVDASDLAAKEGAGRISAALVQVRYSEPADPKKSFVPRIPYTFTNAGRFDALLDPPPQEVAVQDVAVPKGAILPRDYVSPGPGAVQPVWITVHVPGDAAAGEYAGRVTVRAAGLARTGLRIPVRLKVHPWRIPDPKDFVVDHNVYQSHDSVAMFYNVPLWSDRHFELMGKSLALTRDVGNKLCVVHLIAEAFCMGNAESMVRWVRKADGTFTYDYSVFDRYLDLYQKNVGKPALLLLSVWGRGADGDRTMSFGKEIDMPAYARRPRHHVTLLDRATGKVQPLEQPPYGTPQSVAFWRPVLDGVRARLEKRGWFDVAALGSGDDAVPLPKTVGGFKQIWPDGKWHSISHTNPTAYKTPDGGSMPVVYSEHVWGAGHLYNPDAEVGRRRYGGSYPTPWTRAPGRLEWGFPRSGINFIDFLYDSSPLSAWRFASEACIQGNLNGIGRFGADFWPVIKNARRGTYDDVTRTEFNLGPAYSTLALLAPGPDGAIATERYEMFREGVQVAEAVILVRTALAGGKLNADLAKRCQTLLDARAGHYVKATAIRKQAGDVYDWRLLEAAGWQDNDDRLYALADAVSKALADKQADEGK